MSSHIPAGPPTLPHDVQVKQTQGQAVMIWAIGAFCIFGWEWLLCLPQEYERIWKRPINLSGILYLANRYFGLLQFSFVMSLVADVWSHAVCKHMFFWEPVGALISTVLSQMILGTRVYAIYSQNKAVGFVLGLTLAVEIVIGGISVSTTSPPPATSIPGSKPPCGAVMGPFGWLLAFWTMPLFYDALAFLLTAWKAFEFWRREVHTPLFNIIWRDGLLYFFAIFSMNLTNVIIFLTVPKALRAINLTPTLILEVILSCRLLLNLRGARSPTTSQPRSGASPPKWYNSRTRTNPSQNISSQEEPVLVSDSTKLEVLDRKLEPNRKVVGSSPVIDISAMKSSWSVV